MENVYVAEIQVTEGILFGFRNLVHLALDVFGEIRLIGEKHSPVDFLIHFIIKTNSFMEKRVEWKVGRREGGFWIKGVLGEVERV